MPDTPELAKVFGYANAKHGLSRFPVARITFLTHAGTLDVQLGNMARHLRDLALSIRKGSVQGPGDIAEHLDNIAYAADVRIEFLGREHPDAESDCVIQQAARTNKAVNDFLSGARHGGLS